MIIDPTSPIGLIDWPALGIGGMPAYKSALRALEAGYLELADRQAVALVREQQLTNRVERLTEVARELTAICADQARLLDRQSVAILSLSARLALLDSGPVRELLVSGEGS